MSSIANPTIGSSPDGPRWLIDALLADQDDLTAVERFAQAHEHAEWPIQGRFYASLLPANPPGPGQQLAFEVDLDACSGCKACVAACHSLNGLDEEECWRDVGLIVGGTSRLPVLQHVTTACHHCLEPACLTACPVDAYEKDPVTGIVRHLDDQCFGCQYCTLACPYDVPKYHAGKGIVRKCDMCADRLGVGEAPACVQACPHEAIRIRVVAVDDVASRADAGVFLATAPDPSLTMPTTRYLSSRTLGDRLRPADGHRNVPEHVHASLVVMLVMTQLSVGAFGLDLVLRLAGIPGGLTSTLLAVGLGLGQLGLIASTCHLGRPRFAYRALIGLRHSWLSREIAAFGAFSALATTHAALALGTNWYERHSTLGLFLSASTVASGVAGIGCSVMVYHVTRRPFWTARLSLPRFAGTAVLLGLATMLLAASWSGPQSRLVGVASAAAMIAASAWKLRTEGAFLAHLNDHAITPDERSARLLKDLLGATWRLRRGLAFVGGVALPLLWIGAGDPMVPGVSAGVAILAFALTIAGELAERTLFFAAVVRPKMPGGMTS